MHQNLKNFFIAFITGLVVFGVCAILIINFGIKAMFGSAQETEQASDNAIETTID